MIWWEFLCFRAFSLLSWNSVCHKHLYPKRQGKVILHISALVTFFFAKESPGGFFLPIGRNRTREKKKCLASVNHQRLKMPKSFSREGSWLYNKLTMTCPPASPPACASFPQARTLLSPLDHAASSPTDRNLSTRIPSVGLMPWGEEGVWKWVLFDRYDFYQLDSWVKNVTVIQNLVFLRTQHGDEI